MKRMIFLMALMLVPGTVSAQQEAMDRLQEVLPPEVRAQVMERIQAARAMDLPAEAMANLALEGVAKGRSGDEVLTAVSGLVGEMGRAREALMAAGGPPAEGEIEAATAAMRMGVDAEQVRELARSRQQVRAQAQAGAGEQVRVREQVREEARVQAEAGRGLAVPLLIMGGLAERGLPSDQAMAMVRDRMMAGAGDAELLGDFSEVARGLARGMRPEFAGPAMAGGFHGFRVPVAGISVPVGPQGDRPGPGGRRPGGGPGGF